jgi:8-oxo-dGTP pyrophosphatase MutT (NUDIX family)
MTDEQLMWQEEEARLIKRYKIFDLYESEHRDYQSKRHNFIILKAPLWVCVVPVLTDPGGCVSFLMVRQYRFGISRLTCEFPAGMVNKQEQPQVAIRREFQEETGYTCGDLLYTGKLAANPAFMTNWIYFYLTLNPQPGSSKMPDEHEHIHVVKVHEAELAARLGQGEYVSPHTFIGLQFYRSHREQLIGPDYRK